MDPNTLALYLQVGAIFVAGVGAWYFAAKQNILNERQRNIDEKQYEINRRMQELADYVAVFIAPIPGGSGLQVKNVGRVNLYLHKWEIGPRSESYINPNLIPMDPNSAFAIGIPPNFMGQHLVKLYLTDESDRKYLSTGELNIQIAQIGVQPPSGIVPSSEVTNAPGASQPMIQMNVIARAHSFRTVPYDWMI